jgi:hypothetical protein
LHKQWYFSSQSSSELVKKNILMKPKTKLEQFNFDLIDNLNLDNNLDSEEWKKTRKNEK